MSTMSAVTKTLKVFNKFGKNLQSVRVITIKTRMSHGDTNRIHNKNDTPSPIGVMTKVTGLQFKVHN